MVTLAYGSGVAGKVGVAVGSGVSVRAGETDGVSVSMGNEGVKVGRSGAVVWIAQPTIAIDRILIKRTMRTLI
jgi:hypothetical protein